MFELLPHDVLEMLLCFLTDNVISAVRLSMVSKGLNQFIISEDSSKFWEKASSSRWPTQFFTLEPEQVESPHFRYKRRHMLDAAAKRALNEMVVELKHALRLPNDESNERIDGNVLIGQAWDCPQWKTLLNLRGNVVDYLQKEARRAIPNGETIPPLDKRLRSFLAAKALQTIHFAECLYDWKNISDTFLNQNEWPATYEMNALQLERYGLLVNEIQQTPDQLISRNEVNVKQSVVKQLDQLANRCRDGIKEENLDGHAVCISDKIGMINEQLFLRENFRGNTEDYYNYRNSLLDCVLETRKGIPITLAIIYSCICRRLEINVHLVGLPGHLVLGFRAENDEDKFVDVFHGGRILSKQDCQLICASYSVPWEEQFLAPLPAPQVLQRVLNNLANCHFHSQAAGSETFHSDLFFHQRALSSIHRQPSDIAAPFVDRLAQEVPLTLSPDLLRFYGLLSPLHG